MREVYQDWTVTCQKSAAQASKPSTLCQMSQELRDKKSGQLIMSLVVPAKALPDGASAVLVAPFGLNLSKGATISMLAPAVDGANDTSANLAKRAQDPKTHAPFRTCLPAGCLVNFNLNPKMKEALRRRSSALVSLTSADQDRPLNVVFSLKGFQAAERRLLALAAQFE
ncbi:MAG: invasion associated locus B family protein [Rhizobiaceae bacterium]